jgi:hypothetical protein
MPVSLIARLMLTETASLVTEFSINTILAARAAAGILLGRPDERFGDNISSSLSLSDSETEIKYMIYFQT